MLIEKNSTLYAYVIARDFGFAPNPFYGYCTLATCKPGIRKSAKIGDWILGVAGSNLGPAKGKCILLMKVTEKLGFQEYWEDVRFLLKRPCRNGSNVKMVGDNIYHKDAQGEWIQEDSHHSHLDGSANFDNIKTDTGLSEQVLISEYFFYFGKDAVSLDLDSIDYKPGIGYKKIDLKKTPAGKQVIQLVNQQHRSEVNTVIADPCQFLDSHQRVDQGTRKIS